MLVTFKCTAYADITMFGDAAEALLKLMGLSGNVPGALMGSDVAGALAKLKDALASEKDAGENLVNTSDTGSDVTDDDDAANKVALATRAVPLIELLEAAEAASANVMWDT